jgi:ABC-2 type transport system permease protein
MNKVWIFVRKEWSEVFKNRFVFFTISFLPLMFTIIPLFMLNATQSGGDTGISSISNVPPEFGSFCNEITPSECVQTFILTQFLVLYMLLPLIIPATIAAYSIVGEKTTHTLEPLLATPITTLELLAGKMLAAVIPAMVATWGSYMILVTGATLIIGNPAVTVILIRPLWLLAIFGVGPLLSLAGVSIAIMVSSRVNDPRVAEQLSGLVVLPIILIIVGTTSGLIIVNQIVIIYVALVLMLLDAVLLYFAVQLFQRETILTRWK